MGMKLEIDIPKHHYNNIMAIDSMNLGRVPYKGIIMYAINAIKHGKVLEQEPTTKNDLGVDLISRADVNRLICEYRDDATEIGNERDLERAYGANAVGELISELPSVTAYEPFINKPCVSAQVCEHDKQKVLNKINKMKSEIADSLEFWDYSPNNNQLARDMLETLTNFWGDIKTESEDV